MTKLPNRIFFTGVPGSRWSGVAQTLEELPEFNKTDRTPSREYKHSEFSGHKGAYFGREMEFPADLDLTMIDSAWTDPSQGIQIVKSHDWAYILDQVYSLTRITGDRLMLVYRPDNVSFNWWKEAGGFNIVYPSYTAYKDDETMQLEIQNQNQCILNFVKKYSISLEPFNISWVEKHFYVANDLKNKKIDMPEFKDVLVGII